MAAPTLTFSLSALTEEKSDDLLYRLHVLLFDLKHFNQREDSRGRLDTVADVSYIGPPYFTEKEAERIKKTTKGTKTLSEMVEEELRQRLERRNKKRVESEDSRVCAAHDLAPILARALDIDLKQLERDKRFLHLVNTRGLNLDGESWDGLVVKSFAQNIRNRQGKDEKASSHTTLQPAGTHFT